MEMEYQLFLLILMQKDLLILWRIKYFLKDNFLNMRYQYLDLYSHQSQEEERWKRKINCDLNDTFYDNNIKINKLRIN